LEPREPTESGDAALLDRVQRQTFRYFWDFGHPVSGLARDRTNSRRPAGDDVVTSGGSGFGVMAILVAAERGWVSRAEALDRLLTIVRFLGDAERFHGVFPHFLHGATGAAVPFGPKDDGADLVETAFLIQGLLAARQYFQQPDDAEAELRLRIDRLWHEVDWAWHTQGADVLYWHWSPTHGWAMHHEIRGWNECLITYLLAAASPTHRIEPRVYHEGWATGANFRNGRTFHGIELPLGRDFGGPLFFTHYSFLGLDPRGLSDRYADYWVQNRNHVLINRAHCIANPHGFAGYGERCWGLTASDSVKGYAAHAPDRDKGVIAPTAALASMPYTPEASLEVLRHLHDDLGTRLWGPYGFRDAFSESADWVADSFLAIDQGPIVIMIENHRTGLLWNLFMSCPEVLDGLRRLGFESPHLERRVA
jgi:hypothetical protein